MDYGLVNMVCQGLERLYCLKVEQVNEPSFGGCIFSFLS